MTYLPPERFKIYLEKNSLPRQVFIEVILESLKQIGFSEIDLSKATPRLIKV